jgi:predicted nuclease of predicted toxin-antitoxin system
MFILIDECLPKRLKREPTGHTAYTVQEKGWSGKKNGELLSLMSEQLDVFITADQNLKYQQNLSRTKVAIIVLLSPNNRLETLKPLMPKVREVLQTIRPGEIIYVESR